MTSTDGGTNAAYGFVFQFVTTAETFLNHLRNNFDKVGSTALHIESASLGNSADDDDIVDYAIEVDETIWVRTQVKATRRGRALTPSEAKGVFEALNDNRAPSIRLSTNRPLSPGMQATYQVVRENGRQTEYGAIDVQDGRANEVIAVDSRTIGELTDSLVDLIKKFRAENNKSQGTVTCRIVAVVLLYRIFSAVAGEAGRRMSALQVIEVLTMPDRELAEAAGAFDWGVPTAGIPSFRSTVPRLDLLEKLDTIAEKGRDPDGRSPAVSALIGQTGHGKSALAADYCHIKHNAFSNIFWIDSHEPAILAARVRSITQDLTGKRLAEVADAATDFQGALAAHPGPWLLVFDNAPNALALQKYMPTMGNGSVVITSTNSTGDWFPRSTKLAVGEFNDDEAIQCFANYAGLPVGFNREAVAGIVSRLSLVPLAVSMAGVYFQNNQGTLDELSTAYFAELDALADQLAIPAGFDKTAFQAIQLAVKQLGHGQVSEEDARRAAGVLYHATLLAPELLPLHFIIAASSESIDVKLADLPSPQRVSPRIARSVISTLRTQSMAERVMNVDSSGSQNVASETLSIHPLVHEVLQTTYLDSFPPGILQEQALMLMYQLLGWIDGMRSNFEFFALEVLIVHAEALLRLVGEREPLSTRSDQYNRAYHYCKSMLQLELGKSYLARGDMTGSIEMSKAAVDTLQSVPVTPVTTFLALEATSSVVVDLSTAGEPINYVLPFARMSTALILSVNLRMASETLRSFIFEKAQLLRNFLRKRDEYVSTQGVRQVIESLDAIIALDTSGKVTPHDLMDRANQYMQVGNYGPVLEMIPQLMEECTEYDHVTIRCLAVVAQLHTGAYEAADDGIAGLLAFRMHQDYLAVPLGQGLGKIWQALTALSDQLPPTLAARIPEVQNRTEQLEDVIARRSHRKPD